MDWSLVLISQQIENTILKESEAWVLAVGSNDYTRALRELKIFLKENKGWAWKQILPLTKTVFHWGALFWTAVLAAMFLLVEFYAPDLKSKGIMNSALVLKGEWFRLFTAVSLHADLAHLLANLTTGTLILGFAMAIYGPGTAILLAFLGGAAGNLAGYHIYSSHHLGLGASGMVCAGLGLLSSNMVEHARHQPHFIQSMGRSILGGCAIFMLIGLSEKSDLIAHLFGYLAGLLGGIIYAWAPAGLKKNAKTDPSAMVLATGFFLFCWAIAARH